jgi:hypothetical protein
MGGTWAHTRGACSGNNLASQNSFEVTLWPDPLQEQLDLDKYMQKFDI